MSTPFIIIGLAGRMKSGKDEAANMLKKIAAEHSKSRPISLTTLSYADPLKKALIDIFGLKYEDVYTQEGKASYNKTWGMTNRKILQHFGTDAIRNHLHPDAWIFAMQNAIMKLKEDDCFVDGIVVPDVRFVNEAALIYSLGGFVLKIERPSIVTPMMKFKEKFHLVHPSEQPLPDTLISKVIMNDGTLDDMRNKLESWYNLNVFPILH